MNAKLTINTENAEQGAGIFLYTDCEYVYVNDTAQIIYRDRERGYSVTIGLNRDKVSLLRVKEVPDDAGNISVVKQFNVLTALRPDFKEMVDTESMELLFLSDGLSIDYGERYAAISVKCLISVYGGKPVQSRLTVQCNLK